MGVVVSATRQLGAGGPGAIGRRGLVLALLALLAWALFAGGGSSDDPLLWIGGAATLVGLGLVALAGAGVVPWPRLGRPAWLFLLALSLFVAWSALSLHWSLDPDRSWRYANRSFVYLMLLLAAVFVAPLVPRLRQRLLGGLAVLTAALAGWALAARIVPELSSSVGGSERLSVPVGYWNALALICAIGLIPALWLAGGSRRSARMAAALLLFLLSSVLLLTYSRGGVLLGLVMAVLWLWLGPQRARSTLALCAATPAAALLFLLSALVVQEGAGFALGALLGAVLTAALALGAERIRTEGRELPPRRRRLLLAAGLLAVTVVAGLFLVRLAAEFGTEGEVMQGPSRLGELASNNRSIWWGEAWESFLQQPLVGTGAGSFEESHRRLRDNGFSIREPHSLPLQVLSELGLVGFGLLALAVVGGSLAVVRSRRDQGADESGCALALALIPLCFVLHATVDIDWDYVAVAAPAAVALGALLPSPDAPELRRPVLAVTLLALVLIWAGTYSLAAPVVAERLVDEATLLVEREPAGRQQRIDDLEGAIDRARRARRLNPYALDPIVLQAQAMELLGLSTQARNVAFALILTQPDNPEAWFRLGVFELRVGTLDNAFNHLSHAYLLDPYGPAGRPGGPLDELREIFRQRKQECFAAGTC